MNAKWIKPLFVVAGLYDGLLAIGFLFFAGAIFQGAGVEPPNHPAYIQFPAALLLIFAAIFFRIASDPLANRSLIPYGIALKIAYCSVAFWYFFTTDIPMMWMPFAWADLEAVQARRYVVEGKLPYGEIAFRLGFSQQSAFFRAFKRWTRTTPSLMRAQGATRTRS